MPDLSHLLVHEMDGPRRLHGFEVERLLAVMERERLQVCGPWGAAPEPGRVTTEVVVSTPALAHDPARVAKLLAEIAGG